MERRLLDKFLNNNCTSQEAEQVLQWLNTPSGREYLEQKLGVDIEIFANTHLHLADREPDFEELNRSILAEIQSSRNRLKLQKHTAFSPIWRVAAILILSLFGSLFYYSNFYQPFQAESTDQPVIQHYQTDDSQHRMLDLVDGTEIRLNENSQILISADFSGDTREVRLDGEAFFDVAPDPDRPFIIHTARASIRVLGTKFNVKSISSNENDQITVVEGSVSVSSTDEKSKTDNTVILGKGQFAYLGDGEFSVESFGVENYLSWMRGRLIFENMSLARVCTQLTRIYDTGCHVLDDSIEDLKLTTNVSSVSSLEKVLSVISLSLNIGYKKSQNRVIWFGT